MSVYWPGKDWMPKARNKTTTKRHPLLQKLFDLLAVPLRWMLGHFNRFVYLLGWITLTLLLVTGSLLTAFFYSLPDVAGQRFEDLQQQAEQRVRSRLEVDDAHYRWTPLREINRDLMYAVVMAEDARFFQHRGLDYDALLDAFITNLRRGQTSFGGSTISQQTVKNLFLTPQQSYYRKLQEAVLTRRLEQHFSKNQILELYLNLAEFGPDIYGVDAAARYYFGKAPARINAAEGAWLSLLLPSPRRYHYSLFQNRNLTPAMQRKYRNILQGMRQANYISQSQHLSHLSKINQKDWPPRKP